MTKLDWLIKLRQVRYIETLDKIIERKNNELSDSELAVFWGASDHRLAELTMNRLYDHVPTTVWQYVH